MGSNWKTSQQDTAGIPFSTWILSLWGTTESLIIPERQGGVSQRNGSGFSTLPWAPAWYFYWYRKDTEPFVR